MKFPYNDITKDEMKLVLYDYISQNLDKLYDTDMDLISRTVQSSQGDTKVMHVSERAIVYRFGLYFYSLLHSDKRFNDLTIDCEYSKDCYDLKRDLNGDAIIPDLIVHCRGNNKTNLLVIEFKTYWNSGVKRDIEKLQDLTSSEGNQKYAFGLSIVIGRIREIVKFKWVMDGEVYGEAVVF